MKQIEQVDVSVSLITADDGLDRVVLRVSGDVDPTVVLTAAQARALATKLITAVNRAEVKANLKVNSNMRRNQGEPLPRLATAG